MSEDLTFFEGQQIRHLYNEDMRKFLMPDEITKIYTKEHLIVYIDVLGIKNKLYLDSQQKNRRYLSLLNKFIELAKQGFGTMELLLNDINIICFSDNLLIAYDITKAKTPEEFLDKCQSLVLYVVCLQTLALANCFLLRGAISFGDLYIDIDKNFVCGTGLIKAHKQEDEIAIYPRYYNYR